MNDTHDQIMKAVLDYLKSSEEFERKPSHRTKRNARRELRKLIYLAKDRQQEISNKLEEKLKGLEQNQKWQHNKKNSTT
jgi:hypothetical protein